MEDTLRDKNYCHLRIWHHVLILILMEDTLRDNDYTLQSVCNES